MSSDQSSRYLARTKSFTRRGRPLHPSTERTWQAHADKYVIEVRRDGGYTTVAPDFRLDLTREFSADRPVIVEVGSGNGEQVTSFASNHPHYNFLACEVWRQGLAKTISRAVELDVNNLRLVEVDAAQALPTMIQPACVREVWTFFPDPWRKSRHHKRRLVNPSFASTVARILEDGGVWRLATDWEDYAWQMLEVVNSHPQFVNPYLDTEVGDTVGSFTDEAGFAPRFQGRVLTRFEQRGRAAGRPIFDIVAIRFPREHPVSSSTEDNPAQP